MFQSLDKYYEIIMEARNRRTNSFDLEEAGKLDAIYWRREEEEAAEEEAEGGGGRGRRRRREEGKLLVLFLLA